MIPSGQPSSYPTTRPASETSGIPTNQPTERPTVVPTDQPSSQPSREPTTLPTVVPSILPTVHPTQQPSVHPSSLPSSYPSALPSVPPISRPSIPPTGQPSLQPVSFPSSGPSAFPTSQPICSPTLTPVVHPSSQPTSRPTNLSTTSIPSHQPTAGPTVIPSNQPWSVPSVVPTRFPSSQPSGQPSSKPSFIPRSVPTAQPTNRPSRQPFSRPTSQPNVSPSSQPSGQPSSSPSSSCPTRFPTATSKAPQAPSVSFYPTMTKRPSRSPTRRPTVTPTVAPTNFFSVLSSSNAGNHFQGNLFLLGASSYAVGDDIISRVDNINLDNHVPNHDAYLLFGQNKKFTHNIDLRSSPGFVSRVNRQSLLSREVPNNNFLVRSATIVGDINRDGVSDLIIGYPFASRCFVYFGRNQGGSGGGEEFSNLAVAFMIYGETESEFGWAISGIGDINDDHSDDFMISAKAIGVIYVFFGFTNSIDLRKKPLSSDQGFRIISSSNNDGNYFNLGVSLASAGDFNKDGMKDLMFSTMTASSQGIVYILLLRKRSESTAIQDISLDQLLNNNSSPTSHSIITLICPTSSFSGLSVTGIGDINQDGFDDIAIGSLPYRGAYQLQRTYLLYGKPIQENTERRIDLLLMREGIDGITLIGGGFLVASSGDLNNDGIVDLLIINYPFWQGKPFTYFIQFPENMTSLPTVFPSSLPSSQPSSFPSLIPTVTQTTETPTNRPSLIRTEKPTFIFDPFATPEPSFPLTKTPTGMPKATAQPKSFRPTYQPTMKNSDSPSPKPTFSPSFASTSLPSVNLITLKPSRSSMKPSRSSRSISSVSPTIINSSFVFDYQTIYCNNTIMCTGSPNVNKQFIVQTEGTVSIQCGSSQICVYLVIPKENNIIIIEDFNMHKDIIDLLQFPWLKGIEDLSFSTNPQVLFLGTSQQILFRQRDIVKFTSTNFYFIAKTKDTNTRDQSDELVFQFAMIGLIAIFFVVIGVVVDNMQRQDGMKEDDSEEWKEGKGVNDELATLESGERDKRGKDIVHNESEKEREDNELHSMSVDLMTNLKVYSHDQNEDGKKSSEEAFSVSTFLSSNQGEEEHDEDETLAGSYTNNDYVDLLVIEKTNATPPTKGDEYFRFARAELVADNIDRQDNVEEGDPSTEWNEKKNEEVSEELETLEKRERQKEDMENNEEEDDEDYELSSMSEDLITNQNVESPDQFERADDDEENSSEELSSCSSFLCDNQGKQEDEEGDDLFDLEEKNSEAQDENNKSAFQLMFGLVGIVDRQVTAGDSNKLKDGKEDDEVKIPEKKVTEKHENGEEREEEDYELSSMSDDLLTN
jgi:hypothetical protein